jgi:hypothetical protein
VSSFSLLGFNDLYGIMPNFAITTSLMTKTWNFDFVKYFLWDSLVYADLFCFILYQNLVQCEISAVLCFGGYPHQVALGSHLACGIDMHKAWRFHASNRGLFPCSCVNILQVEELFVAKLIYCPKPVAKVIYSFNISLVFFPIIF